MDAPAELYRRWIEDFWNGKLDIVDEIVTDDFVGHWPHRRVDGPDELVALVTETRELLAGLTLDIEVGPLVDGDLVAARWTGMGETGDGPMAFFGNDILRMRDGRFAEFWVSSSAGA